MIDPTITDQAKLQEMLSWAMLLLTPTLVGVLGGIVTWVRPRYLFGLIGWTIALGGGPWAMMWVNNNVAPSKLVAIGYIMLLFHIPVACMLAATACGAVFAFRPKEVTDR
jgi:hypothetical protein